MTSFKTLNNAAGWLVFAIAAIVLGLAAEPTGSLWDCGEFISGAYKLQVVHPPGAPIFLLVGRLFAWIGSMVSSDPANIAYAVNLLSAVCTAFTGTFVCWSTTILSRLALIGREKEPDQGEALALAGAGIVAGLTAAFCTSIWFSAVEGEVYAMSTFFTAMTLWAVLKWYQLPDNADADRWLIFAIYSTALSIGVHLLSLLTFPALAMFYYFKKREKPTILGTLTAALVGVVFIVLIQKIIIAGIPALWSSFDYFFVNSLGLPFYSGILLVFALFGGGIWFGLRYAKSTGNGLMQRLVVALSLVIVAYLSYGMVVIRAKANPPINMNDPSDPMRLLPYLNREQYGERALLRGPNYDVRQQDIQDYAITDRYGRVGDRYEVVDEKIDVVYTPSSKVLFPRMSDNSQDRGQIYDRWIERKKGQPLTFGDNIKFFFRYQWNWMYWRYFFWNFVGRQNGDQGYYSWDPTSGNWISGLSFIDSGRIGDMSKAPDYMIKNQARNTYYGIPLLLGLLGLIFHYLRRPREFAALMSLFIITGIGIIVYSNQPPNEPRERDYVLAASFFTFAMWVGMSVVALYQIFRERMRLASSVSGGLAIALAITAPLLMVTQNWDDHSRSKHYGSRDYASNFLNSCAPNAIIFTYGDNDTYPLWYCQEVEGIRTDVRVVNLSLIAVDWYIDQLRRKINDSEPIKMSIPSDKIRGFKRNQNMFYVQPGSKEPVMPLKDVVKFLGDEHPLPTQAGNRDMETYLPTRQMYIPVDKAAVAKAGVLAPGDTATVVDTMYMNLGASTNYILKDQLALLDIISSNIWDRPIYWAVTCQPNRIMGLQDYLQLEGLGLRLVPVRTKSAMNAYGLIGAGRVNTEAAYKNIMEKWRWGNFDKERLFVDKSYLPSLQTMRVGWLRIARELATQGQNDKAVAMADKFFEVFPEMNFQHDQFAAYMADIYGLAGNKEKAAAKIREIAKTVQSQLIFVKSQTAEFQAGYRQEYESALNIAEVIMMTANSIKDEALLKELESQFAPYMETNPQLPPEMQGRMPQ
jgi:Protein of unknown function (DUF2723)